ncbi:MAG: rod shape-determining protein MreC [Bdellovibrio sp.]
MNWFNFDLRKAAVWLAAALLPLVSINMQQRPSDAPWFDQPFSFMAGIVQNGFFSFSDGVRGTTALYINLIDIKRTSQKIADDNRRLKSQLVEMKELQKENARLLGLLDFQAKTKMQTIVARVISRDLLTDHATIRISKGSHHGLKAGQAVISTEGVVGYVFRPDVFTSQVLLVSDRYAVVDGLVARSRARGIVEGKGPDAAVLRYVEKSGDIQKGDLIVTSGIDNIFPKGFPVAIVDEIENKLYAASLRVNLKPVVDTDKLEEVFVIINAANEDLSNRFALGALQPPTSAETEPKPK